MAEGFRNECVDGFAAGPRCADDLREIIFPLLHGPYGEDGTIQGLLEIAGVPYIGCGVLASAVGMDKDIMKRLFLQAELPVPPFQAVFARDLEKDLAFLKAVDDSRIRLSHVFKAGQSGFVGGHMQNSF